METRGEIAAASVLCRNDRELATLVIGFASLHFLRGTHDIDRVGRRYRGHTHKIMPGPRMHSAFEGSVIELPLVLHQGVTARLG
jgi:hypothetical protein